MHNKESISHNEKLKFLHPMMECVFWWCSASLKFSGHFQHNHNEAGVSLSITSLYGCLQRRVDREVTSLLSSGRKTLFQESYSILSLMAHWSKLGYVLAAICKRGRKSDYMRRSGRRIHNWLLGHQWTLFVKDL